MTGYAHQFNYTLHDFLGGMSFFKQEIVEILNLLTALLVTYQGIRDDTREIRDLSWERFLERMSLVKADWKQLDRSLMEQLGQQPNKVIMGWESGTIYVIKGGQHPEQWTPYHAESDASGLLAGSRKIVATLIRDEVQHMRENTCAQSRIGTFDEGFDLRTAPCRAWSDARGTVRQSRPAPRSNPSRAGLPR